MLKLVCNYIYLYLIKAGTLASQIIKPYWILYCILNDDQPKLGLVN